MGSASKTPHMQGGFATVFDTTPGQCVPVPDHVPLEAAALAEPLAVCLHAVVRGTVAGRSVAIIGAGPIGLFTLLAARLGGARASPSSTSPPPPSPSRPGSAPTRWSTSRPTPTASPASLRRDVVFEVSGTPAGLASAIAAVRRGGTVVQVGNLPGGLIPAPPMP